MPATLKEIQFGSPDAESEIQKYPELVSKGFLDAFDVERRILDDIEYVVLGRKGAGKSLLAKHFFLKAQELGGFFSAQKYLKDFPFRAFTEVTTGDLDKFAKIQPSWQWVLSLALLTQVRLDHAGSFHQDEQFFQATTVLEKVGLLENSELKDIVLTSRKREVKVEIAKSLGIAYAEGAPEPITPISLAQRIQALLLRFRSPNKHLLFIDGLDDVLTSKDIQFEVLSGLIEAAGRINEEARSVGCPIKIVVLCRTDLFEQIPNPNKNKIRQSRGLELDWFGDLPSPAQSPLFKMIRLRATLAGHSGDVYGEYFPAAIAGKPVHEYLLNNTRHTPRDLIALMLEIQRNYRGKRLAEPDIRSAVKNYAKKFLVPELKDELTGYISEKSIGMLFGALTTMHKKKFFAREVAEAAQASTEQTVEIERGLSHLFDCGALAQVYPKGNGTDDFIFKFRNADATPSMNRAFALMRGLEPAFGI